MATTLVSGLNPTEASPSRRADLWLFGAVLGLYVLGGELALGPFGGEYGTPAFFPPAGVSLAALALIAVRRWPVVIAAIVIGETLVNIRNGASPSATAGFVLANVAEPIVGAALLRRWNGEGRGLATRTGMLRFAVAALIIGPAVGAAIGTAVTMGTVTEAASAVDPVIGFALWWTGDSLGVLVVGATLIAWRPGPAGESQCGTRWEWAAVLFSVTVLSLVLFATGVRPVSYLPMAALLWAGLRLGVRGVFTGGLVMAVILDLLTAQGYGPWPDVGGSPAVGLVYLKLFIFVAVLSAWLLAVEVAGRDRAELRTVAERQARESTRQVADQFARVRDLTAALSAATSRHEIARAWQQHATAALGGSRRALYLRDTAAVPDGRWVDLLTDGGMDLRDVPATFRRLSLDDDPDLAYAVAAGQTMVGTTPSRVARVVAPLMGRLGVIGLLVVEHRGAEPADDLADETVSVIADRVGDALERVRLLTEALDAGGRLATLQRLTSRLGGASTVEDVSALVVTAVRPALGAAAGGLLVPDGSGRGLRAAGQFGEPPRALAASGRAAHPVARAMSAGSDADPSVIRAVPSLRSGDPWYSAAGSVDPSGRESPGDGRSWAVFPLRTQGHLRGVLWLGFDDVEGVAFGFGDEVRRFLESVAQQCALALGRVAATAAEHEAAVKLQQALLPRRFPAIDGVAAAARYLASSEGLSVGGDWYDIVSRQSARAVAVIGDVVGHDLAAAASMGQLRSAVSAIAVEAEGPADALQRLDAFPGGETIGFATVCYVDYDGRHHDLRYACAGHPPPVLLPPEGSAVLLGEGRSKPLFAVTGVVRREARLRVDAGSRLVLFTDGLIERGDRSMADGLDELIRVCEKHRGLALPEFTDAVLGDLTRGTSLADDVALLCLSLGA